MPSSAAPTFPARATSTSTRIADPDTDLPHMVPTPGRFAKLIGALGVGNARAVVFYDQKGLASAARGWWLMGLFGHDAAAVLDGGLPKWQREGRPTESRRAPPPRPADLPPRLPRRRGCAASATCWAIVAAGRGAGARRPRRRPLHRRGAGAAGRHAQRPHPRLAQPALHRPAERRPDHAAVRDALRARFAAAGVDGVEPVVTSCGSGVTACILTLGLRARRPARGRRLRRILDRMGRPRRHAGGDEAGDDRRPQARKRGFRTRLSHAGRAGTRVHGFVNPAAASRLDRAVPDGGRAPRRARRKRLEQVLTYGARAAPTRIGRWRT